MTTSSSRMQAPVVFCALLRRQECDNQKNMQHIDIVLEKEDEMDMKRKKINNDKLTCSGSKQ